MIMEAAISFTIYKDFAKYVISNGWDVDYSQALKELNKYVKELVDNGNLVITYDGKPTEIILPIEEYQCGNIFEDGQYPYWEGVEIWCKIPHVKSADFTCDKLSVDRKPACWHPERTVW